MHECTILSAFPFFWYLGLIRFLMEGGGIMGLFQKMVGLEAIYTGVLRYSTRRHKQLKQV